MTSQTNTGRSPVTGAWREGDLSGSRKFTGIGDVALESGAVIPDVQIAYESWGKPNADASNAVLILHALTGDSHVVGEAGPGHASPGWWEGLVGPGKAIDTDRFFVVAPNILGGCQGTTGPSSKAPDGQPWGNRFPYLTVRDQVAAEAAFADALNIHTWHGVIGGSAGGMRALEWAIMYPDRVANLFLLATSATASAEQVALSATQNDVIRADPHFHGGNYYSCADGPTVGLDLARRLAHISYRSEFELGDRFGRAPQAAEVIGQGGRFAVESYLQHHGSKLAFRFDANSYILLNEAMNSHDVGRGRGGVLAALSSIRSQTAVVAIDSDRLYPLKQQQELADNISSGDALTIVTSPHGHDGFLIEFEAIDPVVRKLLGS